MSVETTLGQTEATQPSTRDARDPEAALQALRDRGVTRLRYIRETVRIIGEAINAERLVIGLQSPGQEIDETYVRIGSGGSWEDSLSAILLERDMDKTPIARVVGDPNDGAHLLVGIPYADSIADVQGQAGAVIPCRTQADAQSALELFRRLLDLSEASMPASAAARNEVKVESFAIDNATSRTAGYESVRDFAFRMTNNLRAKVGADEVVFGAMRHGRAKIYSISGQDDVKIKGPSTRRVREAMAECADRGEVIIVQNDDKWNDEPLSSGHRLHAQWRDEISGATVASFPLKDGDNVVAVVSLSRSSDRPFSRDEAKQYAEMLAPFGAGTRLLERANRGMIRHGCDAFLGAFSWLGSPDALKVKALMIALCGITAYLAFGTLPYRVNAPARIVAAEMHHYGSPFEGRLIESHVRLGDRVEAGALLFRFDTRDLELQKSELESERSALAAELARALGTQDMAEAGILRARDDVLKTRILNLDSQMARATARAEFAGIVVNGDLSQRLGEVIALGEPLFEVARGDGLRIDVAVPERDQERLTQELQGTFSPSSRPESDLSIQVSDLRPSAEIVDGVNAFVAEAAFTKGTQEEWVRPGMQGVARLNIGTKPVWWLVSHRTIDWWHQKGWFRK